MYFHHMNRQDLLTKFNLDLPVIASPMFIVSQLDLVKACVENGIIGSFPSLNNRSTEGFEKWVVELNQHFASVSEKTGKKLPPYAVNLIVHRTNIRAMVDLEICEKHKVPIIITSLGAVSELVDRVHAYGGLVFHDVTNPYHAQKAIDAGVDGIICVSSGAGGHAGTTNPIPLVHEIRKIWDGLIILGGCLSTGQDVATALQMGADIAYMGTRFINTQEAIASEGYKQMIIDSGAKDIIYTAAVSGIPGNYLGKSLIAAGITPELWESKTKVDFNEKLNTDEAKAWKDLWSAGQGVASIHDNPPAAALIHSLKSQFKEAVQRQSRLLEQYS